VPPATVELTVDHGIVEQERDIGVTFAYNEEDPHHYVSKWDFLVLHRVGEPIEDYLASRFMMVHTRSSGRISFTAPVETGDFCVSAVRDTAIAAKAMTPTQLVLSGYGSRTQDLMALAVPCLVKVVRV
jgi:hypothetical protein